MPGSYFSKSETNGIFWDIKKALILSSALVGAGLMAAAPASAADKIKLGLGGFMEQWVGFSEQDGSYEGTNEYSSFDAKSDTEVHFSGSTKLDNGLTISAEVELESDRNGGTIDESYLQVDSPTVGSLQVGAIGDAVNAIAIFAPDVGIGNTDGDVSTWVNNPLSVTSVVTFVDQGKFNKVNYFSPTFAGLQVVASYTPDASNHDMDVPNRVNGGDAEAYGFGATYSRQIEGVGFSADVGYGVTTSTTAGIDDLKIWQAGVNLSYAGFVFGGSYGDFSQNVESGASSTANQDGYAWDVGVSYATGPYSVSLSYFASQYEGNSAVAADEEQAQLMLSGAYNMGPGVNIKGSVFTADYDDETTTATANNDGWGAVAGLTLDF